MSGDGVQAPLFAPAAGEVVDPLPAPPSFSVVVPAYEAAATIAEAVESVLDQEPAPLELIVSDDGSRDDLESALRSFGDRIVLLRNPHRGVAATRNAGLRAARGEFVLYADADDILLPGKLSALGTLGRLRPDLDLLATDSYFEREGERTGRFGEVNAFPMERQAEVIVERCFVIQPAFRRSRLLEVGGFDESLRTASDWDCILRLVVDGSVAGLWDEPLAVYRIHAASLTSGRAGTFRDRVRMLEKAEHNTSLRIEEQSALQRSLATQLRRAVLAEAQESLAGDAAGSRRRFLELSRTSGIGVKLRVAALGLALLPAGLRQSIGGRALGPSQLSRPGQRRGPS